MDNLATWLISLVTPIARKAMASLGLGAITYQGVDSASQIIISHIVTNFSQVVGITANLMAIAGFYELISILLGAVVARLTLSVLGKIGLIL